MGEADAGSRCSPAQLTLDTLGTLDKQFAADLSYVGFLIPSLEA